MAGQRPADPILLAAVAAAGLVVAIFTWSRRARVTQRQFDAQDVARPSADAEPHPGGSAGNRSAGDPPGRAAAVARPGAGPAFDEGPKAKSSVRGKGVWQITQRVYAGFMSDRIMTEAAGVTFYALLALFPAIATLVSLYGFFADPSVVAQQLQAASGVIPSGGLDIIEAQVKALTANGRTALGWGVLIGLLTSLWSANQGIRSLCDALNVVYHAEETRSYIKRTLESLALTVTGIVFIALAMAAVVIAPIVLTFVGFGGLLDGLLKVARWPALLLMLALFLAVIYSYGPDRKRPRWKWVTWGSCFAAILWMIGSVGFSYYVQNFGSYNKTYGALGAIIGFMTWIWISMMIVLIGAELNSDLEQLHERKPS